MIKLNLKDSKLALRLQGNLKKYITKLINIIFKSQEKLPFLNPEKVSSLSVK